MISRRMRSFCKLAAAGWMRCLAGETMKQWARGSCQITHLLWTAAVPRDWNTFCTAADWIGSVLIISSCFDWPAKLVD